MSKVHKSRFGSFDYNEIPPGYYFDALLKGPAIQRFWHQNKFMAIANKIVPGNKVLDFGCGPGSFLYILGRNTHDIRAIGVDIAEEQINFAKSHVLSSNTSNDISFMCLKESNNKLPFDDNSFDVVTSIEVIEHIHPFLAQQSLLEMQRVLRDNGRLLLTTPNYRSHWPVIEWVVNKISSVKYHDQHINKFTPNSLIKFIESSGFEVCEISTFFFVAPFVTVISNHLANWIHAVERKISIRLGSLILVEAKKLKV